jgi:hypothetical protein
MEFLRVAKRRSFLSEVIYILLNLALAGAVLGAVVATGTPWLAIALVLLSKWRVLAVRPRFWLAHIETNTVDLLTSVGLVLLMYLAGQSGSRAALAVQIVLAVLYALWLLVLKPRGKRVYVVLQAAVAIVVATMALASLSYSWSSSIVVIVMWVIGYASARHVLSAYSEPNVRLLSLIWGFVFAEIGWLCFHWMIAYTLPFAAGLKLPQVTIIAIALSFLAERVYGSYAKHDKVQASDILLPLLLSLGIIAVLVLFFNNAAIGAS